MSGFDKPKEVTAEVERINSDRLSWKQSFSLTKKLTGPFIPGFPLYSHMRSDAADTEDLTLRRFVLRYSLPREAIEARLLALGKDF